MFDGVLVTEAVEVGSEVEEREADDAVLAVGEAVLQWVGVAVPLLNEEAEAQDDAEEQLLPDGVREGGVVREGDGVEEGEPDSVAVLLETGVADGLREGVLLANGEALPLLQAVEDEVRKLLLLAAADREGVADMQEVNEVNAEAVEQGLAVEVPLLNPLAVPLRNAEGLNKELAVGQELLLAVGELLPHTVAVSPPRCSEGDELGVADTPGVGAVEADELPLGVPSAVGEMEAEGDAEAVIAVEELLTALNDAVLQSEALERALRVDVPQEE